MNIKEARLAAKLTQKEFAEQFEIPLDTVKNWDSGRRTPPEWAEKLLIEKLEEIRKGITTMTKFELLKNKREIIGSNNRGQIYEGCTLEQRECDPELIKSFDSKEDALEALNKYESDIYVGSCAAGALYSITEYFVQENVYDSDGELVECGDVWEFSKMDLSEIS